MCAKKALFLGFLIAGLCTVAQSQAPRHRLAALTGFKVEDVVVRPGQDPQLVFLLGRKADWRRVAQAVEKELGRSKRNDLSVGRHFAKRFPEGILSVMVTGGNPAAERVESSVVTRSTTYCKVMVSWTPKRP
jgi:hypothetical protein